MLRIRSLLAAAVVLAAVPFLPADADARPGDAQPGAKRAAKPMAALAATSVPAEISSTPGAAWRPLAPGAKIPIGATVRSGGKPIEIELGNGGTVELAPGSSASLAGSVDLVLGRGGATSVIRLDVRTGEVMAALPAAAKRQAILCASKDLLVVTRPGANVRARAVPTTKGNTPDLLVGVYAGEASVASVGAWRQVPTAHTVMLRADERAPEPLALGSAPSWASEVASDGASLRIVTGEPATASFALRWNRVEGAVGYLAEVARDAEFTDVIGRNEIPAAPAPALATKALPVGRYFARLRTRGVSGVPGLAGPTRTLRVVRAVLPPGAVAEGGAWILPVGRTIRFDDPAGIELALGQHAFYPATTSFGIGTESALTGRVRLAGEHVSVPIRIAPSTLAADIDVSPKTASWPRDPVTIAVKLTDPKRPVPSFEPKITVKVDLAEVPVAWRREGDTWRARIQPRTGPGPWVVRVEATDPEGNELGRGHLEIIGAKR